MTTAHRLTAGECVAPVGGSVSAPAGASRAVVFGAQRLVAVLGCWMRAGLLALYLYRNPLKAVVALRRWRVAELLSLRLAARRSAFAAGRHFMNLFIPGWPSPAFDRFVEQALLRMMPLPGRLTSPPVVFLALTRMCALRCEHCVEWDVLNREEGLSQEDLLDLAMSFREQGVAQLFLSGGEPLQRFGAAVRITEAVADKVDVWIITSGRGLTTHKAQRLAGAGLTGVMISLDHWDAGAHDRFRGREGAFRDAIAAAAQVRSAGLLLALSICPQRDFVTAVNLRRYADLARQIGASFIQIVEPKPVGHFTGRDVELHPGHQRLLEEFTARLNRDPESRLLPAVSYPDWVARASRCRGAGERYAYVDTEGRLHPCPFCRSNPVQLIGATWADALSELRAVGCPAGTCASRECKMETGREQ